MPRYIKNQPETAIGRGGVEIKPLSQEGGRSSGRMVCSQLEEPITDAVRIAASRAWISVAFRQTLAAAQPHDNDT
jgi:hypothetical protein